MSDPFKWETGLYSDFDGEVIDGWFATDALTGPQMLLFLKIKSDDEEIGTIEQRWSCGEDWITQDSGKTVVKKTDKGLDDKKNFHQNSMVSRLFAEAFKSGAEAEIRSRVDQHGPRNSALWLGLKFHWDIIDYDFGKKFAERTGRESGLVQRLMPVKFLGVGSEGPDGSQTAQETQQQPQTPVATYDFGSLPEELQQAVREVAVRTANPGEFLDEVVAVLESHGKMEDELIGYLADDETWKGLR